MSLVLPTFTLIAAQDNDSEVAGTISSTTYGNEDWVGDGWIGFLMALGKLIPGRWRHMDEAWNFVPEDPALCRTIRGRNDWEILDGYWGQRAEIVLGLHRKWRRTRFEASDSILFKGEDDTIEREATATDRQIIRLYPANADEEEAADANDRGEIIKDGWDHEHCSICWQKISPIAQPEGYFSPPHTWVCVRCYDQFVQPRSLGFIPTK